MKKMMNKLLTLRNQRYKCSKINAIIVKTFLIHNCTLLKLPDPCFTFKFYNDYLSCYI